MPHRPLFELSILEISGLARWLPCGHTDEVKVVDEPLELPLFRPVDDQYVPQAYVAVDHPQSGHQAMPYDSQCMWDGDRRQKYKAYP